MLGCPSGSSAGTPFPAVAFVAAAWVSDVAVAGRTLRHATATATVEMAVAEEVATFDSDCNRHMTAFDGGLIRPCSFPKSFDAFEAERRHGAWSEWVKSWIAAERHTLHNSELSSVSWTSGPARDVDSSQPQLVDSANLVAPPCSYRMVPQ